jgi:RNA recognition motif-containing protein
LSGAHLSLLPQTEKRKPAPLTKKRCFLIRKHLFINSKERVEMNIYVGNLSYQATEDDLKAAFGRFGEVTSVSIIRDKFSGESKGFGFVEMSVTADGEKAIKELDGTPLKGRDIKVNESRPREARPARRPGRF